MTLFMHFVCLKLIKNGAGLEAGSGLRPPDAGEDALDFGFVGGDQAAHRLDPRRLRVQLRHETSLLRQGRQGDFKISDFYQMKVRYRVRL